MINPFESLPVAGFTRPREVARLLGVSVPTAYAWSRAGILPPIFKIGPRASGIPNLGLRQYGARLIDEALR